MFEIWKKKTNKKSWFFWEWINGKSYVNYLSHVTLIIYLCVVLLFTIASIIYFIITAFAVMKHSTDIWSFVLHYNYNTSFSFRNLCVMGMFTYTLLSVGPSTYGRYLCSIDKLSFPSFSIFSFFL